MGRAWILAVLMAGCSGNEAGAPADAHAPSDDAAGDAAIPSDGRGEYLIDEKFNAMPSGATPGGIWTTTASPGASVVVRELPFAADHSVELVKPAGAGAANLSTMLEPQSGRVMFEANVLARETTGFKAIPYIYDGERVIASVSLHDGNIEARVGETITVMQPFVANVWYRVRLVVDTQRDVFDLFVDGVRKAHDMPLRAATDAVTKLSYYVDSPPAGTLLVDSIKVYSEARFIGAPPAPVFDVRDYGAVGDGTTNDQLAIQKAIDAAAGTGGSVLLGGGTFRSGTLTLASDMTFYITPSATLLGSAAAGDYPVQSPATGNTQLGNCRRALLYATEAKNLRIDGGGTLDGQGDGFGGAEAMRPMLIWTVLSDHVSVRNIYLKKSAMWSLVTMESDHVVIDNVNVQSDFITHDGIDVVDGFDVTISNSAVRAGDDAMCLKTGVRRGIDMLTVRDSIFSGSNGGSNGIKFGTGSYGAFKRISIEDTYVKDVQYAAMAVESRQGADVDDVAFHRIQFSNVGSAFFIYLAQQAETHPIGDVPKLGTMTNVSFTDIAGSTASWGNSPHQGSLITGHTFGGTDYRITNLSFTNVAITFAGGRTQVPAAPPEAIPNQYPESNMFGDLPAWGYYVRHVDGISFANCRSTLAATDARQKIVTADVSNLTGTP
jgi:hypothetical protein